MMLSANKCTCELYGYEKCLCHEPTTWYFDENGKDLGFYYKVKPVQFSRNLHCSIWGWLRFLPVGSYIWLVKEGREDVITKRWYKKTIDSYYRHAIGKIGLSEAGLWDVDINGNGFDGNPIIRMVE